MFNHDTNEERKKEGEVRGCRKRHRITGMPMRKMTWA